MKQSIKRNKRPRKKRAPTESEIIARQRADKMLAMYRNGYTMEDLGNRYHFTRSRAQQIVAKALLREIRRGLKNGSFLNPDHKTARILVKEKIQEIFYKRRREEILKSLEKKKKEGIVPERYYSKIEFADAVGHRIDALEKYVPEIFEIVQGNSLARKRMWSRHYLRCRNCGTTTAPHRSFGYCSKCYEQTEDFKNIQRASRMRNKARWDIRTREYLKEYSKRPEVIEKMRKFADEKHFGGNREKVIKKYGSKCSSCGLSRADQQNKFSTDLYVSHLNGNVTDNRLDNLAPFCRKCFNKQRFNAKLAVDHRIRIDNDITKTL